MDAAVVGDAGVAGGIVVIVGTGLGCVFHIVGAGGCFTCRGSTSEAVTNCKVILFFPYSGPFGKQLILRHTDSL